jgi:hypothetical protein
MPFPAWDASREANARGGNGRVRKELAAGIRAGQDPLNFGVSEVEKRADNGAPLKAVYVVSEAQAALSAAPTNRAGWVRSGRRFWTDGSIVPKSRISCIHSSGVERLSAPPSVERRSLAMAFVSARMINRR